MAQRDKTPIVRLPDKKNIIDYRNYSKKTAELLLRFNKVSPKSVTYAFPLPENKQNMITRSEKNQYGEMTIAGYGAVFNSLSEDLGGFREIILPGAFAGALAKSERFE